MTRPTIGGYALTFAGFFVAQVVMLGEAAYTIFAAIDTAAWNSMALAVCSVVCLVLTQVGPALAKFIRETGPVIIEFVRNWRTMSLETKELADHNAQRLDDKDRQIAELSAALARHQADFGQAGLIINGDMKDPIREGTAK